MSAGALRRRYPRAIGLPAVHGAPPAGAPSAPSPHGSRTRLPRGRAVPIPGHPDGREAGSPTAGAEAPGQGGGSGRSGLQLGIAFLPAPAQRRKVRAAQGAGLPLRGAWGRDRAGPERGAPSRSARRRELPGDAKRLCSGRPWPAAQPGETHRGETGTFESEAGHSGGREHKTTNRAKAAEGRARRPQARRYSAGSAMVRFARRFASTNVRKDGLANWRRANVGSP
jgi:hypothetical protein